MHEIVRKIDQFITKASKQVISKGGTFEHMQNEAVRKVVSQYPGVDAAYVKGGFDHRYVQSLQKI